jgi:hypothetical protein
VGWAKLSSGARFNATLLFQFLDSGTLVSQAGVLPADVTRDLKVLAVVRPQQAVNTGLAIANPSSINTTTVNVRRLSALGLPLDTKSFTLGPLQHFARLLDQPPFFDGMEGYDGTIEVSATEPIVAVSLRLDGVELATVSPITQSSRGRIYSNHPSDPPDLKDQLALPVPPDQLVCRAWLVLQDRKGQPAPQDR